MVMTIGRPHLLQTLVGDPFNAAIGAQAARSMEAQVSKRGVAV
jgi:hypothetical protein